MWLQFLCLTIIFQKGQDVQRGKLITQRDNTKDKTLRAVFFGSRAVFRNMKEELKHFPNDVKGISWIVVENPESESTPPADSGTDNIYPNRTFAIVPSINTVADINTYFADKWSQINSSPNDDLENLIKNSGMTSAPTLTFKDTASVLDAVFSFANSLHIQKKYYSADGNFSFRGNYQFLLSDAQKQYDDPILTNITVNEFAAQQRVSGFLINGEFQPDSNTALFDIKYATDQNDIIEVNNTYTFFRFNILTT